MKFNVDMDIMCVCKLCANSTLNISAVTSFSLQQLTVDDELECQQGVPLVRYAARTLYVTTGGWLGLLLCMRGEQGTRSS